MSWLRRLQTRKQANRSQINLASMEDKGSQCLPMSQAVPAPGDVIEDYEILEKIGGNMGLVFKARHRLLDKVVALKLLPPFVVVPSPQRKAEIGVSSIRQPSRRGEV